MRLNTRQINDKITQSDLPSTSQMSQPRSQCSQLRIRKPSVDVLDNARENAFIMDNYSSQATRQAIMKRCEEAFNRNKLYDWQVNVTEALLLGLDCVVIAGTGTGKTMPFGMPLLMDDSGSKIVIIISPLNDLEVEQVNLILFLNL